MQLVTLTFPELATHMYTIIYSNSIYITSRGWYTRRIVYIYSMTFPTTNDKQLYVCSRSQDAYKVRSRLVVVTTL